MRAATQGQELQIAPTGDAPTARSALDEWRSGWPLALVACCGIVGAIFPTYALGVFMKPLSAAFGWTRAEIASPLLLTSISTLFLASGLGVLIDRLGPRKVALAGVPLAGLAIAAVGLAGPAIWTWWLAWAVYAVAGLTLGSLTWTPAIVRQFDRSRGLAFAVGTSGSGLGAALWPPLSLYLIGHVGWRSAFGIAGIGLGVLVTTLVWVLFRGPATLPGPSMNGAPSERNGPTLSQALRTALFWRVALALMVAAAAVSSISVHLPALLTDHGMRPGLAAQVTAAIGPALIIGRLFGGYLLDRFAARFVAAAFLLIPAASCVLLLRFDGGVGRALGAAVLIGLASGVEGDLLAYLLSRYFGLRSFGAIFGAGLSLYSVGYGVAPTLGGLLFDRLGSYDVGLIVLTVLLVACSGVALTFGRYVSGQTAISGSHAPSSSCRHANGRPQDTTGRLSRD